MGLGAFSVPILMAHQTLTSAIAKLVHSLCLENYPCGQGGWVTIIDKRMLLFDSLEELVLSANNITELPSENLPKKLRVLELYGNQISCLKSVNTHPPPPLQHLGLGHNCLGSPEDIQYFTANLWPKLVSLDLSWSGFTELYALVETLSTLPCLRSLILEGNPLTLTPLYPGFALDSLFRLLYLDGTQVTPETRHRVNGLAQLKGKVCTDADVIVSVKKIRGIPALLLNDGIPEFPLISHSYSVSYEFLDRLQYQKNIKMEGHTLANIPQNPKLDLFKTSGEDQNQDLGIPLVMNSTPKQGWAEVIEFNYSSTHRISNLVTLKNFFLRGLWLTVEEEKILSWPAPSAEGTGAKTSTDKKRTEGQKLKDKKKRESILNLIQEAPVKRTLGVIHVELKDLVGGKDKIQVECDLGVLFSEQTIKTAVTAEKEYTNKPKEDMKEDKKEKSSGDTSGQRNRASSKEKGKGQKDSATEGPDHENIPSKMEHLIVEFSIELEKWSSVDQYLKSKK
ncbi:leucine-rich repeat-containing protein 43 isoform X2 [Electrophorus electricus]|uniref:leucine-rich repeat-containing protein 43 isoform X2 n=1 Tax=Electrophorus electricus TaxID=8005 RepID=UPI0015CFD15F|nr:leucine-rich repeat-containing protein 43 isoform X2 [Electrophorus electricus]